MRRQTCARFLSSATVTIALAGCTGSGLLDQASAPPVAPAAPAIAPEAVVGSWGLGSYHREEDRARTETAARNQCGKPYEIARGTNGGVIMHLADQPQAQELVLKGSAGGRTFIGPPGEAGGPQDREILSYDGKIMIMRWVDAGVGARYGTLVFARCGPARTAATPR